MEANPELLKLVMLIPRLGDELRSRVEILSRDLVEGCTLGDIHVLARLMETPDVAVRPSDLVGDYYTTSAGITGSLRRLEEAGHVERFRDTSDRRLFLVRISERGREAFENATPHFDRFAHESFSSLTEQKRTDLSNTVTELLASLG